MKLLGVLRFLAFLLLCIIVGIGGVLLFPFFLHRIRAFRIGVRSVLIKGLIILLNITIHKTGEGHADTALYVGNHISYADPAFPLHYVKAYPVAKSEVASWPIFGWLARLSGIYFVARGSRDKRVKLREALQDALATGLSILNYPEGTTTDGSGTAPFLMGSFKAAEAAGVPIVPVTIWYPDPKAAFIGDDAFVPHFIQFFSKWRCEVYMHIHEPLTGDAQSMRQRSQLMINQKLAAYQSNRTPNA